ncbi:alpha/beta fold hydrolase [Xanthomonas albilineans]|uniref:thioesterase domain-containing protein n=1 Tax=Xanthomonas albilineans TaxID=29447 RepID=UPI0009B9D259|nr:alpha/beta fold hydrolase [Xanthomonas albilineans]
MLAHPTSRQQADPLVGAPPARDSHALAVRSQGTRPPLFVVPTDAADIAYAFALADHLDADIPVYALPWSDPLPTMLETLATQMVDMIQAVQPHGPYHLLGYSSGGLLAYAIAQHLGMHDAPVAFLGLIDCDYPDRAPDPMTLEDASKQHLLARMKLLLQRTPDHDAALQAAFDDLLAKAGQASLQELAAHAHGDRLLNELAAREQTSLEQLFTTSRMRATFERMWPTYWAQRLAPHYPLTVFHASEPFPEDTTLGWTRLLPPRQVQSVAVPGTHVSLIEAEHLPGLGQCISATLCACESTVTTSAYEPAFTLQLGRATAHVVVCVPGAGDSMTGFVDLSSALGQSCHVIGMQPRGTDGSCPPFGSVELAAQHYLDALPGITNSASALHLIGHSFGGWVVLEMALRLHALGRQPASLTLIDTRPPHRALAPHDCKRDMIVDYFLDALQMRVRTPLNIDRQALHRLGQDALIQSVHRVMVKHGLMPQRSRSEAIRGSLTTFAHCCRTTYTPAKPYPGTLHLVLVDNAQHEQTQLADTYQGLSEAWVAHAADLRPWRGPGNHMTVLAKPHSQTLAEWWMSSVRDTPSATTASTLPRAAPGR